MEYRLNQDEISEALKNHVNAGVDLDVRFTANVNGKAMIGLTAIMSESQSSEEKAVSRNDRIRKATATGDWESVRSLVDELIAESHAGSGAVVSSGDGASGGGDGGDGSAVDIPGDSDGGQGQG